MNISDLLCSPVEAPSPSLAVATCAPPRRLRAKKRQANFTPDDQRKRPYRMSVAQKKSRQEFQLHESTVFNLTLDINQLKQQVQYLLECRDLQITCLLQTRQRLETEVLSTVNRILFGGSDRPRSGDEGCSFSRMFMEQSDGEAPANGVYEFSLQLDKPNFNHRSCSIATTQVMAVVEEDPEGDDAEAAEVRKICREPGGCLVEAVGEFTGRFTRQIIVSMFPHVLSDEMMVAQIIGLSIKCPARLLLYFNANRVIVRQIAQADVFAALAALEQAKPREFAAIMGIMELSRILCREDEQQVKTSIQFVRKRPHRLSIKQRQRHHEHEAYESRVFNLTLDINELRQQIKLLMERRDLYTSRLLLHRQQRQCQTVAKVWDLLSSYHGDAYGLTPSGSGRSIGNRLQFVMQRGCPAFSHRSFVINCVRVLVEAEEDSSGALTSHIRHVCGARGGCIVDVSAVFTGRITRDTLVTMLLSVINDEALAAQLIGSTITFPTRLLLYFEVERRLVLQVMEADIMAAINTLNLLGNKDNEYHLHPL